MSVRHEGFLNKEEKNTIISIVYESLVRHHAFDSNEKKILKNNKDDFYDNMDDSLDSLYVYALDIADNILEHDEED